MDNEEKLSVKINAFRTTAPLYARMVAYKAALEETEGCGSKWPRVINILLANGLARMAQNAKRSE